MNEAGLVIDIMWLDATQYPPPDARPELHVLQWTQYLLDTCRTVEEVLATDAEVRISQDSIPPQHFLVCDAHSTVWSVVYDIGEKRILFRTHNHREIRRLDLSQLKFDCAQPVPVWDVLSGGAGDITGQWTRFTAELNRETARKNVTHPAIVRTFGDLSALPAPVSGYAENLTACED